VSVHDAGRVSSDKQWSGVVERHFGGDGLRYYKNVTRHGSVSRVRRTTRRGEKKETIAPTRFVLTRGVQNCRLLLAESGPAWQCSNGGGGVSARRSTCHDDAYKFRWRDRGESETTSRWHTRGPRVGRRSNDFGCRCVRATANKSDDRSDFLAGWRRTEITVEMFVVYTHIAVDRSVQWRFIDGRRWWRDAFADRSVGGKRRGVGQ